MRKRVTLLVSALLFVSMVVAAIIVSQRNMAAEVARRQRLIELENGTSKP